MIHTKRFFCLIFLTLASILPLSGSASATQRLYPFYAYGYGPIFVRQGPDSGYGVTGEVWGGWRVIVECQSVGEKVGRTEVWNKIVGPRKGWISDSQVRKHTKSGFDPSIPRCDQPSSKQIMAANWALGQVGKTKQPNGLWWSMWCDRFAANAFGRPMSGFVNAKTHYFNWKQRGLIHSGPPPIGTLVFYNTGSGHVAISLGDGRIVTTPNVAGQKVRIAKLRDFPNYLGWAYAGW